MCNARQIRKQYLRAFIATQQSERPCANSVNIYIAETGATIVLLSNERERARCPFASINVDVLIGHENVFKVLNTK